MGSGRVTLKRRIEKLEPSARKAWERAWNAIFEAPFDDKSGAHVRRLETMTQEGFAELGEQLTEDQQQYPALLAWDDSVFVAWTWEFDRWLKKVDFDWDNPNLAAWPWLVPDPPRRSACCD